MVAATVHLPLSPGTETPKNTPVNPVGYSQPFLSSECSSNMSLLWLLE